MELRSLTSILTRWHCQLLVFCIGPLELLKHPLLVVNGHTTDDLASALEELHGAFVFESGSSGLERAQISAPPGLRIRLP